LALAEDSKYQLESLFERHYTALVLYGLSIVKDKEDAEDIVQRSFISLWGKMDSVESPRAYLYKSVYHASLDLLKHKKIRKHYEDELKINTRAVQGQDLEENELNTKIEQLVNDLPEQCRKIFSMSRYDRLRNKEIAAALHISEKTVENQMTKALKILREKLAVYLALALLIIIFFYGKR
jgi:RNA polymerase sigma-70 factor (ECF subfamily)